MRLLVFSNFSQKLKSNRHLAPPSIQMLETSIVTACYFAGISADDGILFHDEPWECKGERMEYALAVTDLARRLGMKILQPDERVGYREAVMRVAGKLKKEFAGAEAAAKDAVYFWLEHDWWMKHPVEIEHVRRMFARPDCNYIKLTNYHDETERFQASPHPCLNFSKDKDRRSEAVDGFMRDTLWSTNPHFGRISKLIEWAGLAATMKIEDAAANGGANGVDWPLCKAYFDDIDKFGFEAAHARWGVWLYMHHGTFNRRVEHMGI